MFSCGRVRSLGCVILLAATGVAGCRDSEPPRSYYRDVGTDARPLLPTTRSWHTVAVKDGAAEWHPFHSPSELAAEDHREAEAEPAGGGVEAEIRELIEEFNALLAERDYEGATAYFVEDQAATVEELLGWETVLAERAKALADALAETLPEAGQRFAKQMNSARLGDILTLTVESLEIVTETMVVGRLLTKTKRSPDMPTSDAHVALNEVRFVYDKDEDEENWFIDLPRVEALAGMLPIIKQAIQELNTWLDALKSGQITPQAVAAQIETTSRAFELLAAQSGRGNDSGSGEDDSENTPTQEGSPED